MIRINVVTANRLPDAACYSDAQAERLLIERQRYYDGLQKNRTGKWPESDAERTVLCTLGSVAIRDWDLNAK